MTGLSKEFLAERDTRIFAMRKAGVPIHEIARRFGMTTSGVNTAIRRTLEKLNREALMAYPEVLRMELERLDSLQQSIWPLTQHRKVKLDDGTEIAVEPDLKAVAEVRAIMAARSKLLGIEQTNIQLTIDQPDTPQRATLAGVERPAALNTFDPETEARKMLEIMAAAGIMPEDQVAAMLGTPPPPPQLPAPEEPPHAKPQP